MTYFYAFWVLKFGVLKIDFARTSVLRRINHENYFHEQVQKFRLSHKTCMVLAFCTDRFGNVINSEKPYYSETPLEKGTPLSGHSCCTGNLQSNYRWPFRRCFPVIKWF